MSSLTFTQKGSLPVSFGFILCLEMAVITPVQKGVPAAPWSSNSGYVITLLSVKLAK